MEASQSLDRLVESAKAAEREGAWDEALAAYESAFVRLTREGTAERAADLLRWIGHVHRHRGDLELASELYEASLAVARAAGLTEEVPRALNSLGIVAQHRGRIDLAEAHYIEARALAEAVGDVREQAMIAQNLGTLANIRGDMPSALSAYRSALDLFQSMGQSRPAAWVLNNMGMAHVDLEEWPDAERCLEEAERHSRAEGDAVTLGSVELNRADMYLKRDRFVDARESCDRAFEIFGRAGSTPRLAETYKFYGILYRETGKSHLADTHLARALEYAESSEDRLIEAEARAELALLHLVHERNERALQQLNRAHALFERFRARRELLDIENRLDWLETMYLRVVRQWAESIESKDRYTAGHCERVADYSCMLAEAMGFEGRDLSWFRMGALLHDVGKTAVSSDILNKPGPLTDEEFEAMKRHTVVGDEIISDLGFPWNIRPMVRNHHEHWDGTGYPDGLAGDSIPLAARILCVADVYDALTTERSYRAAMPRADALSVMDDEVGKTLDPNLYPIFREHIEGRRPQKRDVRTGSGTDRAIVRPAAHEDRSSAA